MMNSIDKYGSSSSRSGSSRESSFWRKSGKPLPGRPNPSKPLSILPNSPSKSSSAASRFRDYESSVSDAWDIGDHDEDRIQPPSGASIHCFSSSIVVSRGEKKAEGPGGGGGRRDEEPCSSSSPPLFPSSSSPSFLAPCASKKHKIQKLLDNPSVNLEELRKLAWSGIPPDIRSRIWRILCGYLPPNTSNRDVVTRKREEYKRYVEQYFLRREEENDSNHQDTYRQIHIDIPRMSPVVGLFQQKTVQEMFERILYIWAIRHPASGYVQGINDLVTPFFLVFLQEYLPEGRDFLSPDIDLDRDLTESQRDIVEADSFWCLAKVLDGIQDHYTFAQPGIQLKVKQLEELIKRIDVDLHNHLVNHDVFYLQFAFRWMNNLLMREIPIKAIIRLWDTYLAEKNGFSHFHLYVTAAFLMKFKDEILRRKDFHTVLMFLQNLPTAKWGDTEIELIVAEAYQLNYLFADAPNHLHNFIKANDASSNK